MSTGRECAVQMQRGKADLRHMHRSHRASDPAKWTIPWQVAEQAWAEYAERFGNGQSLERIDQRGGFSLCELDSLFPGWQQALPEDHPLRSIDDRLPPVGAGGGG